MELYEKMLKAADLLEEKGWCLHEYSDDAGRHCVVGAMREFGYPSFDHLEGEVDIFLSSAQLVLGMDPVSWNDYQCRDVEDAALFLRETAGAIEGGLS